MNKRIIAIPILIVLLSTILSPVALSSETDDRTTGFTSTPSITIDYNPEFGEITPNYDPQEISLQVSYEITGILSGLHEFLYRNKDITVKLEIIDKPEWCEASLSTNSLNFGAKRNCSEPKNTTLSISVDENAPAFIKGAVKIRATSTSIKGIIFTKVGQGNLTFEVPFSVGYLPTIDYSFSEENYREIPPLNTTKIPINITNLGNGETTVIIEVKTNGSNTIEVNYPSFVKIDPPLLGGENAKEIEIEIYPYKNFTKEILVVKLTPQHSSSSTLQGETISFTIEIENDGSYVEENELELDTTLLIGIIAVIILVLALVLILRRKRSK